MISDRQNYQLQDTIQKISRIDKIMEKTENRVNQIIMQSCSDNIKELGYEIEL